MVLPGFLQRRQRIPSRLDFHLLALAEGGPFSNAFLLDKNVHSWSLTNLHCPHEEVCWDDDRKLHSAGLVSLKEKGGKKARGKKLLALRKLRSASARP